MKRCTVCGRKIRIRKKDLYTVLDDPSSVVGFLFSRTTVKMDAIDCPHCGCQQVLSTRLEEKRDNDEDQN